MIRPRYALAIAGRHARDLLREKRTLIGIVLIPMLVILVFFIESEEVNEDLSSQSAARQGLVVQGAPNGPRLVSFLRTQRLDIIEVDDVAAALRDDVARVGIDIPSGFDDAIDADEHPKVSVVSIKRSIRARFAQATVTAALDAYASQIVERRLARAGLPASTANPLRVETVDLSTAQERTGSALAEVLPFMLLAQVIGMTTGVASDITVGEKERRTIEALVAAPVTRSEIVFGKWLVTVGIGLVAGTVTLIATLASLVMTGGGEIDVPVAAIATAGGALVSALLVLAAVQMIVGFLARSVQQAGILFAPLFFFALTALFISQAVAGEDVGPGWYAIPAGGPALLLRFGVEETAHAAALPVTFLSSALYAIVGLTLASRLLGSERALRRTGG